MLRWGILTFLAVCACMGGGVSSPARAGPPTPAASGAPSDEDLDASLDAAIAELDRYLEEAAANTCVDACRRAREASTAGRSPCRRSRLPRNYFCAGTDRIYVNPFAIARAGADDDVCKHFLLLQARHQSDAALARTGADRVNSASARSALTSGQGMIDFSCARGGGVSGTATGLASSSVSAVASMPEVSADTERSYCRNVVPPGCAALGGRMVTVSPPSGVTGTAARSCVANGTVIDQSCLSQSPGKLENLRAAISNVRGSGGVGCLRGGPGRGGVFPAAGQQLADHMSDTQPRTQICCVTGGCSSPISWFRMSANTLGAHAAADSIGNENGGTIRIPPGELNSRNLKSMLFHEFLHQIGLCKSEDHNTYNGVTLGNWMRDPAADGSCPSGYVSHRFGGNGQPDSVAVARHLQALIDETTAHHTGDIVHETKFDIEGAEGFDQDRYLRVISTPTPLPMVCIKRNGCGSGFLPPPPPFRAAYDNVYACELMCYDRPRYNRLSETDKRRVGDRCRGPGTSGTTIGGNSAATPTTACLSEGAIH